MLEAPLDVVAVRKVGHPWQPEYALGAVTPGTASTSGRTTVSPRSRPRPWSAPRAAEELDRRLHASSRPLDLAGRTVARRRRARDRRDDDRRGALGTGSGRGAVGRSRSGGAMDSLDPSRARRTRSSARTCPALHRRRRLVRAFPAGRRRRRPPADRGGGETPTGPSVVGRTSDRGARRCPRGPAGRS